eukprot:scaffold84759_cov18-Tisochrysis_lutea.AAC.1
MTDGRGVPRRNAMASQSQPYIYQSTRRTVSCFLGQIGKRLRNRSADFDFDASLLYILNVKT